MKVAIIGAGASGLTSLKECLDEGIEAVILEKENHIGGLWKFEEDVGKGGTVYRSTVINTSKEMMCFSDFPIPENFAPYMHNTSVMKYFDLYAQKFNLYEHIQFNTYVQQVKPASDYSETGRWDVITKPADNPTAETTTTTFDGIMVCSGHHWDSRMPSFKGMDVFKGRQLHSHDYKDYRGHENTRAVVVGIGNSGVDVASELSQHCSQVYLSTRRGAWVFSRLGPGGDPIDVFFNRYLSWLPSSIVENSLKKALNERFDHAQYGLKAKHKVAAQHPTISDELPIRIVCGAVKVKDNIACLHEHDIEFTDGSIEKDIDTVVYCTGYKFGFSFLDSSIVDVKDNQCDLYKYAFPPHLKHPTLAMVGFVQPVGAIMPIAEMQARWITRVFNKKCHLPSEAGMMIDIEKKRNNMAAVYVDSPRHTIQVDFIQFMDEIADLIGCKPSFFSLMLTDPSLVFKCIFGPCTPPQFRLRGPHAWDGAKNAIRQAKNNIDKPTRTRQIEDIPKAKSKGNYLCPCTVNCKHNRNIVHLP
ncbi:uncharacterized protein TRIADDRAFT_50681 [Trichoplax adhaerens]|uniref:Flavin-containing monooxygenase n=1 Tax=Trichoplax adhaerens TaxID=10228 RepID=B3S5B7_TRIAD|nr:hypothetical protein TRIADDRAFT_50681 [Trichoplax adhaerens]EDV22235.1 hypothetical protein TRIADDRAFT_50681 [Trichoplax adhaerens]|eukprot:XP_002115390.1 hypothetical protein TRIADDRAFT_50681 [Trichoplax adhaerens]